MLTFADEFPLLTLGSPQNEAFRWSIKMEPLLESPNARAVHDHIEYERNSIEFQKAENKAQMIYGTFLRHADKIPPGFPQITEAPSTKVVEISHTTVLHCSASGNPPPKISWIREMLPVDTSRNPRYNLLTSGAPGALQITNSIEEDQGKYEFRRVPPQFSIPPPALLEVMLDSPLNLSCVAVGSPMPFVKWRKGQNIELTPDDKLPVGRNVLTLDRVTESENYTCIAASVLGVIETSTIVKVQSLPVAPLDVKISEVTATSVRLDWTYPSETLLYYVIQYKPKAANTPYSEISGIITTYYTVRNLSPYTEYEFYIIAVNNLGRGPPSSPAVITTGETEPGTAPRDVQVRPLSSSTMVIQWDEPETPNGQITGYKVYYTQDQSLPMSAWETQVVDNNQLTTISDLTPHTIYTIRVQAFTSVGPGPLSAPVLVKTQQGVPSQPRDLRAVDIQETAVTLAWSKPTHSGENIISYELYWNDTYAKAKHHRRIGLVETYSLTGLYPNTLYYIWLAAQSPRGEGATTPPIPVRTKQYVPGAPPQNVSCEPLSSTSIRISWEPPPVERSNGHIVYYKLQFVETGRSDSEASIVTLKNQTSFVLDELKKWTEYRIWVLAGTSIGDGPSSYPITIRTHEDVPGPPTDVKLTNVNSTTVHVEWRPPNEKERNGVIRGYHIHVQETKEEGGYLNDPMRFDVSDGGALELNVTGLQPDTIYTVQVAALTRKGDGDRSKPETIKTPGGVPNRPHVNLK
ncbi:hypothetical protein M8J76_016411 [Diaphorina citri]|nr:hypothetical protein M8J76_016411 [Diaphorina citri]